MTARSIYFASKDADALSEGRSRNNRLSILFRSKLFASEWLLIGRHRVCFCLR
ncbi:hypothetical protein EVA_12834 [gut metagenome]|uniref:Uncharacterized protein n=1 Tax=gut metagenome TaxID=749906 RepID=J9GHX2_9ZZZZ